MLGPDPDNHAATTPLTARTWASTLPESGLAARRDGWCSRSRAAAANRSVRPVDIAATHVAAPAMDETATSSGTGSGSPTRDVRVDVVDSGDQTTSANESMNPGGPSTRTTPDGPLTQKPP